MCSSDLFPSHDIGCLGDYFGLPTVGQVGAGKEVSHSALPLRAYNLIFNEWFRDQNLVQSFPSHDMKVISVSLLLRSISHSPPSICVSVSARLIQSIEAAEHTISLPFLS